jgi:polyhydroxyalkanoate synthesis regulator phasin
MADKSDIVLDQDTVTIRGTGASPVVDIEGGNNWDLAEHDGDLRIGDDDNMLKMGVALGGAGAGNGRIWASTDLKLGSEGRSIASVESGGVYPTDTGRNLGSSGRAWDIVGRDVEADTLTVLPEDSNDTAVLTTSIRTIDANVTETATVEDLDVPGSVLSGLVPQSDDQSLGSEESPWDTLHVKDIPSQSDRRLKTDVESLEGGLDAVLDLRPVSYTWRENGSETKLGLIAQEVRDVLPEIVSSPDDDGYLGVDYTELVAVLVDAIQDQQAETEALGEHIEDQQETIDEQAERIESQQERIEDLEERLDALEGAV